MKYLPQQDLEIYQAIKNELTRQRIGLEMIASENLTSPAVMEAMGTVLTNKYSEGYPGKRYYSGNEFIDIVEQAAIERVKQLFGAPHANVQPHSGSQANAAAYFAVLNPGDKILAMNLSHGGHLTHGSPVNFSGRFYNVTFYGVRPDTGRIDMDEVEKLALEIKPKLILAGFSAYPRQLDFKRFREIADKVDAYLMVDMAHIAGLIAAKIHPDPMPYADIVTTTTHKTLRGPRGGLILCNLEDRLKAIYRPEAKKNLAQQIDSAVFPGNQGGPLEHIIAAKAVCFKEALTPDFNEYQKQIVANAKVLAETLVSEGFKLISDGTDNHLILMNLSDFPLSGKQAEHALEAVGIYTNKNMVPDDKRPPTEASGIRLGTPALTTRGFKEEQIKIVGKLIAQTLKNPESESVKTDVKNQVSELVHEFPVYPELDY